MDSSWSLARRTLAGMGAPGGARPESTSPDDPLTGARATPAAPLRAGGRQRAAAFAVPVRGGTASGSGFCLYSAIDDPGARRVGRSVVGKAGAGAPAPAGRPVGDLRAASHHRPAGGRRHDADHREAESVPRADCPSRPDARRPDTGRRPRAVRVRLGMRPRMVSHDIAKSAVAGARYRTGRRRTVQP